MPKPEEGETEKEFLKRCIPYLIKDENYAQKQAVAICYSIYRKDGSESKSPKPTQSKQSKQNLSKLYCYMCDY